MVDLKKPLTYDEQINHLINTHNLTINDKDTAIKILKKVNYYRLSAYGLGLTQKNDSEKYLTGTTLEQIYKIYKFDSVLRNMLIHVIEQLEIQLRTQISYFLAIKYGAEGYINHRNFSNKKMKDGTSIHSHIINNFQKECEHQKNVPFVKHHMSKYAGHFPIWVAIELFTFGNLSSLYGIMLKDDRKAISKLYQTRPQHLESWILALVETRNICAHYSRLYNMPLKQTPYLYSENRKYRTSKINKIFPLLLVIKRMLCDDELWTSFAYNLEKLMNEYNDVICLAFIGFPNDWKSILLKKL